MTERDKLDIQITRPQTPKEYLVAAYMARTGSHPCNEMKLSEIGSIAIGRDVTTWKALNWAKKQLGQK